MTGAPEKRSPLEDHISNLEDLYAGCLQDNADAASLASIWSNIQRLQVLLLKIKTSRRTTPVADLSAL